MKVTFDLVILAIICFCAAANGLTIPGTLKVCHRSDAHLDECLKDAIQTFLRTVGTTEIPSMQIPQLEPLQTDRIVADSGTHSVQMNLSFFNVKAFGFSKSIVEKAHYNSVKKVVTITTTHAELRQEAEYNVKGKVLVLPVFGNGSSVILLTNSIITHDIHLAEEPRDGKTYLKVIVYDAKIKIGRAHFDFKNLFDGNKMLGDNILNVINDNWDVIMTELIDTINKTYSKIFENYANMILNKLPVEDIFSS